MAKESKSQRTTVLLPLRKVWANYTSGNGEQQSHRTTVLLPFRECEQTIQVAMESNSLTELQCYYPSESVSKLYNREKYARAYLIITLQVAGHQRQVSCCLFRIPSLLHREPVNDLMHAPTVIVININTWTPTTGKQWQVKRTFLSDF